MADIIEYKCPCCGGAIEFNSDIQKMKCPYCDSEFEMETLQELDADLTAEKPENLTWDTQNVENDTFSTSDDVRTYVCRSCGGEITTSSTTSATSCPYCDNPIVMSEQVGGVLRPDCIIPFKLDKETAKQKLTEHFKTKKFLPKVFVDQNHIDEIKGIYVPFWLFDADADAQLRFRGTKLRTWSDSRNQYTETQSYLIKREGSLSFEAVPVDGSSKMPDDLMESLEPYDISQAVDFQTAYLAGYFADKYDIDAETSVERVNERIRQTTEQVFSGTVNGYASLSLEQSSIRLRPETRKIRYALYPVWLLNTTWNDTKYVFAMNGQTGKFVGDLPVDNGAFWKYVLGLTAIIGVGAYLLFTLFSFIL